jgi:hypothetical protein
LTEQLPPSANQTLELVQAKFKSRISSIDELSLAELNQTQAQITQTSVQYDYPNTTLPVGLPDWRCTMTGI